MNDSVIFWQNSGRIFTEESLRKNDVILYNQQFKEVTYMNRKVSKTIGYLVRKIAERDANTSCPFWGYQPKLPEAVRKLKKS